MAAAAMLARSRATEVSALIVEHLNTAVKDHRMFGGKPFRGWAEQLALFTKITLHAAAVELRSRRARDGPRYAGYGWWPHS